MRATDIKILTMGSAMLITSAAAMAAGPPIQYGGFTANSSGVIAPSTTGAWANVCGTTFTCGAELTGNGFYQRSLTKISGPDAGKVYYQTIILPTSTAVTATTGGASLGGLSFADENFIQQGGGNGIADNQSNYSAGTTSQPGNITTTTVITAGWAQDTSGPTPGPVVTLSQKIDDPYNPAVIGTGTTGAPQFPATGSDFFLDFGLAGDGTQATQLKIKQSVSLCKDLSDTTCTDKQIMDVRRKIATAADVSNEITSGMTSPLPSGAGLVGNQSVAFAADDIIQVVWLGQTVTTNDTGGAPDQFGYQGYTNVTNQTADPTDTTTFNSYSSQTDTGPFGTYDAAFIDAGPPTQVFGSAPTF